MFQTLYDWIKSWSLSPWMSALLKVVQDIIIKAVTEVGEQALRDLERLVISASRKDDLSGREKFEWVFANFTDQWVGQITVTDRVLNLIIELIYNRLRNDGIVRRSD